LREVVTDYAAAHGRVQRGSEASISFGNVGGQNFVAFGGFAEVEMGGAALFDSYVENGIASFAADCFQVGLYYAIDGIQAFFSAAFGRG